MKFPFKKSSRNSDKENGSEDNNINAQGGGFLAKNACPHGRGVI